MQCFCSSHVIAALYSSSVAEAKPMYGMLMKILYVHQQYLCTLNVVQIHEFLHAVEGAITQVKYVDTVKHLSGTYLYCSCTTWMTYDNGNFNLVYKSALQICKSGVPVHSKCTCVITDIYIKNTTAH